MTKETRKLINELQGKPTKFDMMLFAIIITVGIFLMAGWYFGFVNLVPNYHAEYRSEIQ